MQVSARPVSEAGSQRCILAVGSTFGVDLDGVGTAPSHLPGPGPLPATPKDIRLNGVKGNTVNLSSYHPITCSEHWVGWGHARCPGRLTL